MSAILELIKERAATLLLSWNPQKRTQALVLLALLIILAAPFLLRPAQSGRQVPEADRLVIITPHNETIRAEFAEAFEKHMLKTMNRQVLVDWRTPGGTSEITKVIDSEVEASFQNYWKNNNFGAWADAAGQYNNRKIKPALAGGKESQAQRARRLYLESDAGIGIDLFFGGGAYDFSIQASKGHLVAADKNSQYGIAPLMREKADWFNSNVIDSEVSGEVYYDPQSRWVGTCLSSFGICFNRDSNLRLGISRDPDAWEDLADPLYFSEIALADPSKSGSVNKAFEMLLQQQMRTALEEELKSELLPGQSLEQRTQAGLEKGWARGMYLIQRITANARYFTDSATKIPQDVAAGDAAAGMCVDFYGRSYQESTRGSGSPRVYFITPVGGSSYGVDPIAMFRGAPHPELAHAFIRFVLSKKGQRLWNYRSGEKGGPSKVSLRRLPIRKDMYEQEELLHFSDASVLPFEQAEHFTYEAAWTEKAFSAIRFIIRMMSVDTHKEQKEAWKALIENDFPPRATQVFDDLSMVNYQSTMGRISKTLASTDRIQQVKLARSLSSQFRSHYIRARDMARRGE